MYINGEGIEVLHQPAAHTDGDSVVFFRRSDVVVAGDMLDTTRFPVIDVARGGSIQGEIDALNRIVDLAIPSIPFDWRDEGTLVIPGHGRLLDQLDVVEYRDMVSIIRDRIRAMLKQGQDAGTGQGRIADPGIHPPLRCRLGPLDDQHVRRGGLHEPHSQEKHGDQCRPRSSRSSLIALISAAHACRGRPPPPVRTGGDPPPSAESGGADRSDRLLGLDRHRGLALSDGDADEGRLPGRADERRGAQGCRRLGSGRRRSRRQPVQVVRRRGNHARARTRPHHLAGRPTRCAWRPTPACRPGSSSFDAPPAGMPSWQGDSVAQWERPGGAAAPDAAAPPMRRRPKAGL